MISHRHACIFVHIPKTGGTSIEDMIWPPERTEADLWMGFVRPMHNKYQTGGLQHLLARQVAQEVGEETFNRYFRFSFVRNPWDRVVSQFAYMQQRPDLRDFIGMAAEDGLDRYLHLIREREHVQWIPQIQFLTSEDGRLLVDFIGRFETFSQDVGRVMERLGLAAAEIPHLMKSERGSYADYYDAETRDMVAELYASDIDAFGYRFEDR